MTISTSKLTFFLLTGLTDSLVLRDPDVDYVISDLETQLNNVQLAVDKNRKSFTRTDRATNQSVLTLQENLATMEYENLLEVIVMGAVNIFIVLCLVYNFYNKTCGAGNVTTATFNKLKSDTKSFISASLSNVHFGHKQIEDAVSGLSAALDREKIQSKQLNSMVVNLTEEMKAALAIQDQLNDKIKYMMEQRDTPDTSTD